MKDAQQLDFVETLRKNDGERYRYFELVRKSRGWTREELAERAGVSDKTIQRIEEGISLSEKSIESYIAAFDNPLDRSFLTTIHRPGKDFFETADQIKADFEKLQKTHKQIPVREFSSLLEFASFLSTGHVWQFQYVLPVELDKETEREIAEFWDIIRDFADISGDIPEGTFREDLRPFYNQIKDFQTKGIYFFHGRQRYVMSGKTPEDKFTVEGNVVLISQIKDTTMTYIEKNPVFS